MARPDFEIFHYLDGKSPHLEAHFHDFYEIYFLLEGNLDYWIDGSLYPLVPGDILLIRPTQLHKPLPRKEAKKYERIVLWINKAYLSTWEDGALLGCLEDGDATLLRLSPEDRTPLFSPVRDLIRETYGQEFGSELCARAHLLILLTRIHRLLSSDRGKTNEEVKESLVSNILSYINTHFSERITLDLIANHFFINKYYLAHQFKEAVGTSLYRYITLKRLGEAYLMLQEGRGAQEISALCGFSDYTAFYRAFKAEYGRSPTQCRKE